MPGLRPRHELPPGPRAPLPLQTAAWLVRPGPFLARAHAEHGDVFTVRIAGEVPWVALVGPDAVQEVFTGDPAVLHAGRANRILLPFLGRASVLLLDGPEHLRQRKLMLPPFHGSCMAGYHDLIAQIAREHVARWPRGEPLALAPRFQAITLEVVLRVIFGVEERSDRLEPLRRSLARMMERLMSGASLFTLLALGPDRAARARIYEPVRRPVDRLLAEQIAERRARPGDDVLSLLVSARGEDGGRLSDAELRDELVTLLVAGHETTATALGWTVERLVRRPGGWAALQAGGELYAEAAGKEALRLRPVIPLVVRHLQAPLRIAGHDLPAGAVVAPCIQLVHRRPELYPEPAAFRPERFLGPHPQGGTYTWIPFGGGVRRCLGAAFALMELRVVLAELARSAAVTAAEDTPEPTRRRTITLVPGRGARVVLR